MSITHIDSATDHVPFDQLAEFFDAVLDAVSSGDGLPIADAHGVYLAVAVPLKDCQAITAEHTHRWLTAGTQPPTWNTLTVSALRADLEAAVNFAGQGGIALVTTEEGQPLAALVCEGDWGIAEDQGAQRMFAAADREGDDGTRHAHAEVFAGMEGGA